jgi:hypothetical protein
MHPEILFSGPEAEYLQKFSHLKWTVKGKLQNNIVLKKLGF